MPDPPLSLTSSLVPSLGYLGPPGSNSHQAAIQLLNMDAFRTDSLKDYSIGPLEPYPSFYRLMEAVALGQSALGIVPVENALEGAVVEVNETLGLGKRDLQVHAEFLIPISHALIQIKPGPVSCVLSHPQALGQCRNTLFQLFGERVETVPTLSTSEAVRLLAEKPADCAAIGTDTAARIYGYSITRDNISDSPDNQTRFLLVSPRHSPFCFPDGKRLAQKTSLCLGLVDRPGILAEILWELKAYGVNLSRIESRPSKKRFGEYYFYMDVDGDLEQPQFLPLFTFLKASATYFNMMGPYACLGLLT